MSDRRSPLSWLWPKRLLGQTVLLVLIALLVSQIIGALVVRREARTFYRGAEVRFLAERIAPYAELMNDTPAERRQQIAAAISNRHLTIWLSDQSVIAPDQAPSTEEDTELSWHPRELVSRLSNELANIHADHIRVLHQEPMGHHERMHPMQALRHDMIRAANLPAKVAMSDTVISIGLNGGQWMNAALSTPPPRRLIRSDAWITFFLTAVILSVIVFIALGRITRPLAALSDAARKLGRGEDVQPLHEEGPDDVKDAIHAFNEMQDRLRTFVSERTRMLAAISHDLRTPITSLRLRAEMLDDEEARERMIATLSDMQDMIEATLAFAREEASREPTRPCDLAELLEAIADDLRTLGHDIELTAAPVAAYPCRPLALRRALSNLIENAAVHGGKARITLVAEDTAPRIRIEDDGPGIPDAELERIFEPFVRLDTSRNTETGGSGLGMSIARDIVRRHGGDVTLANVEGGGLRVTVSLPPAPPGSTP